MALASRCSTPSSLCCLFDVSRSFQLDDGRSLVVTYESEGFGWSAYVPGEARRQALAASPGQAIAAYLDLPLAELPPAARELSERFESELSEAARHVCDCCGLKTLLNPGYYKICPVCGWEDDRVDRRRRGPDAPSGPNRISLTQGRANFRRFGAAKEESRRWVRDPRPGEQPPPDD